MPLTPETKEMLRDGKGYRCESYGGSGVSKALEVIRHELDEQGNTHIIDEACVALGIPCDCETPVRCDEALDLIAKVITEAFGPGATAVWMGRHDDVKERYCQPDEEPDEFPLFEDALVLSDLGEEGALVLRPAKRFTTKGRELVAQQRREL